MAPPVSALVGVVRVWSTEVDDLKFRLLPGGVLLVDTPGDEHCLPLVKYARSMGGGWNKGEEKPNLGWKFPRLDPRHYPEVMENAEKIYKASPVYGAIPVRPPPDDAPKAPRVAPAPLPPAKPLPTWPFVDISGASNAPSNRAPETPPLVSAPPEAAPASAKKPKRDRERDRKRAFHTDLLSYDSTKPPFDFSDRVVLGLVRRAPGRSAVSHFTAALGYETSWRPGTGKTESPPTAAYTAMRGRITQLVKDGHVAATRGGKANVRYVLTPAGVDYLINLENDTMHTVYEVCPVGSEVRSFPLFLKRPEIIPPMFTVEVRTVYETTEEYDEARAERKRVALAKREAAKLALAEAERDVAEMGG